MSNSTFHRWNPADHHDRAVQHKEREKIDYQKTFFGNCRVELFPMTIQQPPVDLSGLTQSQLAWVKAVVNQFKQEHAFSFNPASDIVNSGVLEIFGDALRIHHAMSRRALSKTPFEYAFEKALQLSGIKASLANSATNPGYDLMINDFRVSLKTEAAKKIQEKTIHVSKWMEMGKGLWDPVNIQLPRFLQHLNEYDRILTLRCLEQTERLYWYELVEIPKDLMLAAAQGSMEAAKKTRQETSPWYCRVKGADNIVQYYLYFDAGSERKLQVKGLRKDMCVLHATWKFDSAPLQ